jgi:hypothetical protein
LNGILSNASLVLYYYSACTSLLYLPRFFSSFSTQCIFVYAHVVMCAVIMQVLAIGWIFRLSVYVMCKYACIEQETHQTTDKDQTWAHVLYIMFCVFIFQRRLYFCTAGSHRGDCREDCREDCIQRPPRTSSPSDIPK